MTNTTIPVAIYARYSSDLQNPRSIDAQVASCRARLAENEEVVEVFTDSALTGRDMENRPGLMGMLDAARAGRIRVVYTEGLDRLSRDLGDMANIQKTLKFNNCEIRTQIDGDDINRFMVAVKGVMNEAFSDDIRVRTKRGHVDNIRNGKAAGGIAYGYRKIDRAEAGWREIHPEEAAIVLEIFERFAASEQPARIVADLNARRVPTKRGGRWQQATILGRPAREASGILKNEQYTGKLIYNRNSYPLNPDTGRRSEKANPRSKWTISGAPDLRIISDELFAAAQKRIERDFSQNRQKHGPRKPATLSKVLCCACNRPLHHRGGGRYRCNGYRDAECGHRKSVKRDDILLGIAERIENTQKTINGNSSRTELGRVISQTMDKLDQAYWTAEGGGFDPCQCKAVLAWLSAAPEAVRSALPATGSPVDATREQIAALAANNDMDGLEELVCRHLSKVLVDMKASPAKVILLRFRQSGD